MKYVILICLAGIAVTLTPVVLWFIWPYIKRSWDAVGSRSAKAVVLLAMGLAALFGGTKGTGTISYPRTDPDTWYLIDNGSFVTNSYVRINFQRNVLVPNTANFFVDGLDRQYENLSDWATHSFNAYSNTFDRMTLPFDIPYANASNYDWIAYTDWTPPPVIHTNGVAYVAWQIGVGKATNDLAMTRTGVYTNAVRVAPNPAITNGPTVILTTTTLEN